jgi:transcriptional regulator with XRE-family HTH domain
MRRDLQQVGYDLRSARLSAGLTMAAVGDAIGVSPQTIMRAERPETSRVPDPVALARHAAVVGLRIRIAAYPEGPPIRDASQVATMRAFRERISEKLPILLEQPVTADPADRRAFDLTVGLPGGCGVEVITRFYDCQAQLRSALLKQRDSGHARLLIVIKETHANRRAVAAAADLISTTFPIGTRAALVALANGADPGANALIFI